MALLDKPGREQIIVYPEETYVDEDGNTLTRPSTTGIPCTATIQIENQSGTSSRRQEKQEEGFESERVYRVRLPRSAGVAINAQAQIEWQGVRWSVFGDLKFYNGSNATRHTDFSIRRF